MKMRGRQQEQDIGTVTGGLRATMMSHFGHEAIFTLDYTINENQMFDCLMPGQWEGHGLGHGQKSHPETQWTHVEPLGKCCNFAKVPLWGCLWMRAWSSSWLMCARAIRE
ncbi:hypothetical protein ACLKA6_006586 [Drosophila palustris]